MKCGKCRCVSIHRHLFYHMKLDIVVYNSFCRIVNPFDYNAGIELDNLLAFGISGAKYTPQYLAKRWDGRKHMYSLTKRVFPTGYLSDVIHFLESKGMQLNVINQCNIPKLENPPLTLNIQLWDHQANILQICAKYNRGLIQAPTGSGKSLCIAGNYAIINTAGVILTQRRDLMYQLRKYLSDYLNVTVGIFGDGKWEKDQLTVAMIQSLVKVLKDGKVKEYLKDFEDKDKDTDTIVTNRKQEVYSELIDGVKFLVADEVHRVGANGTYKLIQAMKNAYWRYGYSATAYGYRDDKKDFLIKSAIGDVITKVTISNLVKEKKLVPTTVVEIGFSHAKKKYPKDTYTEFYTAAVVENEERNKVAIETAYSFYKRGKDVLIAVTRIAHGKMLEKAMTTLVGDGNVKFLHGEDTTETRKHFLKEFSNKRLPVMISTLLGEGIDIKPLEVIVNIRGEESKISTIQLMGRAMRIHPGKDKAIYVDIMDYKNYWLGRHSKIRRGIYRDEETFTIVNIDQKDISKLASI